MQHKYLFRKDVYTFIAPIKPSNYHFVQIDLEPDDLHGRGMPIKQLTDCELAVMRGLLEDSTLEEIRRECDFMHDEIEKLAAGLLLKFQGASGLIKDFGTSMSAKIESLPSAVILLGGTAPSQAGCDENYVFFSANLLLYAFTAR